MSTVRTDCSTGSAGFRGLGPFDMVCSDDTRALRSFRLISDGCSGPDKRFEFVCDTVLQSANEFGSDVERETACNAADPNDKLEYWDRQPALCEDNEVMAALHFDTSCGDTEMKIKAICRPLGRTLSEASLDTACSEIKGKEVMYLDRHNVACSEGHALGRVRLTSDLSSGGSCSGDDMTLAYGCRATTEISATCTQTGSGE